MDRCEALGMALQGSTIRVVGVELCSASATYGWVPTGCGTSFEKKTIFKNRLPEEVGILDRLRTILAFRNAKSIFIGGYQRPDVFLSALILRVFGCSVYLMNDSRFEDKPRRVWLELLKYILLLPYCGALVAGPGHCNYLRFLGFRKPVVTGYDTISVANIHALTAPHPPQKVRPWVFIGRFVAKKNIETLLRAYHLYTRRVRGERRPLILVGDGPLREDIENQITALDLKDSVRITGFLQRPEVVSILSGAYCLLVPSYEEQWGLVVNEAVATCIPIVASTAVGATEVLLSAGRNGFLIAPYDVEGWASTLNSLDRSPDLRDEMANASRSFWTHADVDRFVSGVKILLGLMP